MENNENVVDATENVEAQTTEQIEEAEEPEVNKEEVESTEEPVEETTENEEEVETEESAEKLYTDEELDEIIARKLSRQKKKLEREYKKKYSRLETVVNTGLGTSNVDDATEKLTEFYEENGINIPPVQRYSDEDLELLATAEADKFIKESTYKELIDELKDIAEIPEEQLTERDRIYFLKLDDERKRQDEERAVLELGITKDKLETEEFKEFSQKLNPKLSIKEKYEIFLSTKPKKETKKIGSMKSGEQSKVKDFYTADEISKLTEEDLDDPEVWKHVRESMTKLKNTR